MATLGYGNTPSSAAEAARGCNGIAGARNFELWKISMEVARGVA